MCDRVCQICEENEGKYNCPTCLTLYCSLNCYRSEKHIECSENFYKKCVEEELECQKHDINPTEMAAILRRTQQLHFPTDSDDDDDDHDDGGSGFHSGSDDSENDTGEVLDEDDDDYPEVYDLPQRLENVDLDNEEEIWEKLNPREKKEFKNLISNGDIIALLPEWQPWWKCHALKILINEIESEDEKKKLECKSGCDVPSVDLSILPFTNIKNKQPSVTIPYMIANVLMSYAFTTRWLKGMHTEMPVEAVSALFTLSSVMRENAVFDNFIQSYVAFEDNLRKSVWLKKYEICSSTIQNDVIDIIKGKKDNDFNFSIKACLCDICGILNKSSKILRTEEIHPKRFSGAPPTRLQIKSTSKKILYYLTWIETYGKRTLEDFANTVKHGLS